MGDYIAELVGFAVVIAVIWWKVAPPVRKAMRNQQQVIADQVEEAKQVSERLALAQQKYSDALAEARTEAAKIRDGAREDAQRIVVEMREQAEREVERIRQRGEEELVSQRQQVIRDLRAHIGDLSVSLAGQLVADHLSSADRRAATVDGLLDELEAMAGQRPGPATGKEQS